MWTYQDTLFKCSNGPHDFMRSLMWTLVGNKKKVWGASTYSTALQGQTRSCPGPVDKYVIYEDTNHKKIRKIKKYECPSCLLPCSLCDRVFLRWPHCLIVIKSSPGAWINHRQVFQAMHATQCHGRETKIRELLSQILNRVFTQRYLKSTIHVYAVPCKKNLNLIKASLVMDFHILDMRWDDLTWEV